MVAAIQVEIWEDQPPSRKLLSITSRRQRGSSYKTLSIATTGQSSRAQRNAFEVALDRIVVNLGTEILIRLKTAMNTINQDK